jgi:hypothetical protein
MDDSEITAGSPSDGTTLTAVLADYESAGYLGQLLLAEESVSCTRCGASSRLDEVELHSLRRLEGASDPADMVAVLAVACPACRECATLVVRYGPEASRAEAELLRRSRDLRPASDIPGHAAPHEVPGV